MNLLGLQGAIVLVAEGAPGNGFEDIDENILAVLANLVDILLAVNVKALDRKRRFKPGSVHFRHKHPDLEIMGMNFLVLALQAGTAIRPARNIVSRRVATPRFTPEKLEHRIVLDLLEWRRRIAAGWREPLLPQQAARAIPIPS